jgi:hypothetical protein
MKSQLIELTAEKQMLLQDKEVLSSQLAEFRKLKPTQLPAS